MTIKEAIIKSLDETKNISNSPPSASPKPLAATLKTANNDRTTKTY